MIALTHARTVSGGELQLFDSVNVPQRAHFFPDSYKRTRMGISYPPHNIVEKMLDEAFCGEIAESKRGKTGFILASGCQVWWHESGRYDSLEPGLRYNYNMPFLAMTQIYASRMASRFGARDHVSTDGSACASSLKCLMDVANLIETYGFERVVVLAVDDVVNNLQLNIFGEAGASLSHEEELAGILPSAFDETNRGFHLAQGAAIAVFEKVRDDMAQPLALLRGQFAASEDLDNAIAQRRDGAGFRDAILGALTKASVAPKDIGLIKAHGTGTALNNVSERAGLAAAGLEGVMATALKPEVGHTMGASGLLETILLLERMLGGSVPAIANRTRKDTVFLSEPAPVPGGLLLSLAAGMGNIYAAAILEPC